jgi:type IV pilus assembly protein PilB
MQRRARFGELLSRLVPLSGHDIEEILQEQTANRRKFGDIALSWGLCKPEHIWDAWAQQSAHDHELVDLEKVGVDTQAAALLPAEVARKLNVIPVRMASDIVLVATADAEPEHMSGALNELLRCRVRFVRVEREQLERALERYYPTVRT